MEPLFTLPIRFRYRQISRLLVPERTMVDSAARQAQFDRLVAQMTSLSLAELAAYMNLDSFTRWERAVVHLTVEDCRLAALVVYLGVVTHQASSQKELKLPADSLGFRANPKDLQHRTRYWQRILVELTKPQRRRQALDQVGRALLRPPMRKTLREGASLETVLGQVVDEYMDRAVLRRSSTPEVLRGFERSTHITFLQLVLLHEDDALVRSWLETFRAAVDPYQQILERLLRLSWEDLLIVSAFSVQRNPEQTTEGSVPGRVAQLEQELATLRAQYDADVQGLLAVIEQMRQIQQAARDQAAAGSAPVLLDPPVHRLDGKRILVVGDESHATQYRQLVEAKGGVYTFVPGFEKDHSLRSRIQGADAVVFVTAYASHLKFYATKARLEHRPMVNVNQAGVAAFERGLQELQRRLARGERQVV